MRQQSRTALCQRSTTGRAHAASSLFQPGSGDILCGNEGGDGLAPSLCHVTGNLAPIIRLPSRSEIDTGNTGPLIGLPGLSFFRHNGSPPTTYNVSALATYLACTYSQLQINLSQFTTNTIALVSVWWPTSSRPGGDQRKRRTSRSI